MERLPTDIAGFTILQVKFPGNSVFPHSTTHYLYLKPHDPPIPDADSPRSLFLVNIPVTTTELCLKNLFATQLEAGRVEHVYFSDFSPSKPSNLKTTNPNQGRKRKRINIEEFVDDLENQSLPDVWKAHLHAGGATAVVVFLDRPSMLVSLKAAKKASKRKIPITWGSGTEEMTSEMGLKRYTDYNRMRYPSRNRLLHSVDSYMTAYAKLEEARSREAKRIQVPDEDGFVTVTKGAKGGVVRKEDAQALAEKRKIKKIGLEDFYRFQMREKRKEQQGELMRKFEEDKRRIQEMKMRRGRLKFE